MIGLCTGDEATLVIPPEMGYADEVDRLFGRTPSSRHPPPICLSPGRLLSIYASHCSDVQGVGDEIPPGATLHFTIEVLLVTPSGSGVEENDGDVVDEDEQHNQEKDRAYVHQQAQKRKEEAKRKAKAAQQKRKASNGEGAGTWSPTQYQPRERKPGDAPLKKPGKVLLILVRDAEITCLSCACSQQVDNRRPAVDKNRDYEKEPMTQEELRALVDYSLETGDMSAFVTEDGDAPTLDEVRKMEAEGAFGSSSSPGTNDLVPSNDGMYDGYPTSWRWSHAWQLTCIY